MRLTEICRLSGAKFYDRINTIPVYQFIKPFLDQCLLLGTMEPLTKYMYKKAMQTLMTVYST